MLLSSPELSSPGCADKLLEKGSGDDEFSGRGRAGACPEELHRVTGVMSEGQWCRGANLSSYLRPVAPLDFRYVFTSALNPFTPVKFAPLTSAL